MLEHHIQKNIVATLALSDGLRFSELQPDGIENKLFNYHLKKVMLAGLVEKNDSAIYQLTPEGKRLGLRAIKKPEALADSAYSVLFLIVRRKTDNAYLLYKRLNHPLKDMSGFMHDIPRFDMTVSKSASQTLKLRTGLSGDFHVLGSGIFRMFDGSELESFTNFTLLVCENAVGELKPNDDNAEYYFDSNPSWEDEHMLPNMKVLGDAYDKREVFFMEKKFQL